MPDTVGEGHGPKRRSSAYYGACAAAVVVPLFTLLWILGAPPREEPLRAGRLPVPVAPDAAVALPSPPASSAALVRRGNSSEDRPTKEQAKELSPVPAGDESDAPQKGAEWVEPPAAEAPAGAPDGAAPIRAFSAAPGLSDAKPEASGGYAAPAAEPASARAAEPAVAAPIPRPVSSGPAARLSRGYRALLGHIAGKGGSSADAPASRAPETGAPASPSASGGRPDAANPGGAPASAGFPADGRAPGVPVAGRTGGNPGGGGGAGRIDPGGENGPGPGPGAPGGPGGPGYTTGDAEKLERRLKEQAGLLAPMVGGLATGLDGVLKRYRPQVGKAAAASDAIPDGADAAAFFAPGGRYPDAATKDDIETFRLFIVTSQERAAPGKPLSGDGPDIGLRARLHDTEKLIDGMGDCLSRFGARTSTKTAAGPSEAELACVDSAERALRRRTMPALGFIPVAKSCSRVLGGAEEAGSKKSLRDRYESFKAKGAKDPAAKEAAETLHHALRPANGGVRDVLAAFKDPPFEPGERDKKPREDSKARAAELRKILEELKSAKLPPGPWAAEMPRALAEAIRELEDAALGLGQGMTADGKKLNAASQYALAVRAAAAAFAELERARAAAADLARHVPEGPASGGGDGGGKTPGGPNAGTGDMGLSLLGLLHAKTDCDAVVKAFGGGPVRFGYLETTFGNRRECLNRLLKHPKFEAVRVHLWNGPCVDNDRCASNELLHGETNASLKEKLEKEDAGFLKKLRKDAQRVKGELLPRLPPESACYVSGILEHHLSSKAAKRVVALMREVFGERCRVVNSPSGEGPVRWVGADVEEWHGDGPKTKNPCIVDPDGSEVADYAGYAYAYSTCKLVLLWNGNMNCFDPDEAWVPPLERKNCPSKDSLAPLARALKTGPLNPLNRCEAKDRFRDGYRNNLWKEEADHQEDKSVIMFKTSYLKTARAVQVLDAQDGEVLASVTCDFSKPPIPGSVCGVYGEDGSNRPFFRAKKVRPGKPVRVRLILRDGSGVCFDDVKDPGKRVD